VIDAVLQRIIECYPNARGRELLECMANDFASNESFIDVVEASILPEWTIEWAIKQGMSAADADYLASCCPTSLTAFERRVLGAHPPVRGKIRI